MFCAFAVEGLMIFGEALEGVGAGVALLPKTAKHPS
jgi:hypothetical protein